MTKIVDGDTRKTMKRENEKKTRDTFKNVYICVSMWVLIWSFCLNGTIIFQFTWHKTAIAPICDSLCKIYYTHNDKYISNNNCDYVEPIRRSECVKKKRGAIFEPLVTDKHIHSTI